MNEVGGGGVEQDNLHGDAQLALEVRFDVEGEGLERGRGRRPEEHPHVDIAAGSGRAPGDAAEEIDGGHIAGAVFEVAGEALLDPRAPEGHAAIVPPARGRN